MSIKVTLKRAKEIADDAKEANVGEARLMAEEVVALRDRIKTIADEAFGPFPVLTADEAGTEIERGVFAMRQELERASTLAKQMADAADTMKAEAATWKGAVLAILHALKNPPLCYMGDDTVLIREGSTTADVVRWLKEVEPHLNGAAELLKRSMEHALIVSFSAEDEKAIRRLLDCCATRIEDDAYCGAGLLLLKNLTRWPKGDR